MNVKDIATALDAVTVNEADFSRTAIGAYAGDLLSWVMGHGNPDNVWVTIMSNNNVIAVSSLIDFSCIILAEGVMPDEEFIKLASEKDINVLSCKGGIYEICASLSKLFEA